MLGSILWRVWKWLLHVFTGHCELYRIALADAPIQQRTSDTVRSLKVSRNEKLRDVARQLGLSLDIQTAVSIIIGEKRIKPPLQQRFTEGVTPCLIRVSGVKELWSGVEALRAESYQQTNPQHEEVLMELWSKMMVGCELSSRISKQWQDIGFQGDNPATDFRGMGVLSLRCLLYFSSRHSDKARSVLLHSRHPQYWYPWAVAGIDLTGQLYTWLKDGTLDSYLYATCTEWPPPVADFMEIFCYVFWRFDSFWANEKPENVMVFPVLKNKFFDQLRVELDQGHVLLCL